MTKQGLPPTLSPQQTKVLILGSFPSEESLKSKQYYSNLRNRFWKVIFAVIKEHDPEDYEKRIEALGKRGICLWDLIDECDRNGSLDKNITNVTLNDFDKYTDAMIVVNGKCIKKKLKHFSSPQDSRRCFDKMIYLPSTSSSNRQKLDDLVSEWRKYLLDDG